MSVSLGSTSLERLVDQPTITFSSNDVAALGSGTAMAEVVQIGDYGMSRSATLRFDLP